MINYKTHIDITKIQRNKGMFVCGPRTHGMSNTRVYRIWAGMIERCSPTAFGKSRNNYYLRGIEVCDRWKKFENFLQDMGIPNDEHSLDRINGNGNYEVENCRWATIKEQNNNTENNVWLEIKGERKTIAQWAETVDIKSNTIVHRLKRGWSPEKAVTSPVPPQYAWNRK